MKMQVERTLLVLFGACHLHVQIDKFAAWRTRDEPRRPAVLRVERNQLRCGGVVVLAGERRVPGDGDLVLGLVDVRRHSAVGVLNPGLPVYLAGWRARRKLNDQGRIKVKEIK